MASVTALSVPIAPFSWKCSVRGKQLMESSFTRCPKGKIDGFGGVRAWLFDPTQQPIIEKALKEPVAFLGGVFAGLLRLDLNEEPLKEWVVRTVEASGITEDEIKKADDDDDAQEETPQQIEIE